ncbi:hypothetical protein RB593_001612 [Gaeumannomyces tritici]
MNCKAKIGLWLSASGPGEGPIRITLTLTRSMKIEAGQYIYLTIPSLGLFCFFQSHPFVVISCAEQAQKTLELFIEPRKGFTSKLLYHTNSPKVRTALISGPYGVSIPIINFDTILMVASGYGIAAQMPYLEKLLASGKGPLAYNIHVVWLISTLDILNSAANCSLNRLLEEDLQRVLLISIYSNSNEVHYSRYGERAASFKGDPDFSKIISGEINENFFTKGSNFGETGKMLVLVSANEKCRSRLKRGLRESLNKNQKLSLLGGDTQVRRDVLKISYRELEFQP